MRSCELVPGTLAYHIQYHRIFYVASLESPSQRSAYCYGSQELDVQLGVRVTATGAGKKTQNDYTKKLKGGNDNVKHVEAQSLVNRAPYV